LFARGQFRWTAVGIVTSLCAGSAYYLIGILLPKALIDQGAAVRMSFGITTIVFMATIPGKAFTASLWRSSAGAGRSPTRSREHSPGSS
jgi:hypothetical protein